MNNYQLKILIVRLSAIGDVIHSLPAVSCLRKRFPDAVISWVVEDKAADVILNNPILDKVYVVPKKKWKQRGFSFQNIKEFCSLIKEIRSDGYDIAIDLQELFKSGIITFLSGAKRRIAHAGTREFAEFFVNEKLPAHDIFDPKKLIIQRYLEPAAYLGADINNIEFSLPPATDETVTKVDKLFKQVDTSKPVIAFSPATIWPTKHWIESYWSELLDLLSSNNTVIFLGSNNDTAMIQRIIDNSTSQNIVSFAGQTDLFDLMEIFRRTDILVAPDTGPAHIANAVGKPAIVTIFGPTSHKRSCPVGEQHNSVSLDLACQPCFRRKCNRSENQMVCMKGIKPETIFEIITEKLSHKNNVVI